MDAHARDWGYTTKGGIDRCLYLKAIEWIAKSLRGAVTGRRSAEKVWCWDNISPVRASNRFGVVHGMKYPLVCLITIRHNGIANAVLLPYVMNFPKITAAKDTVKSLVQWGVKNVDSMTKRAPYRCINAVKNSCRKMLAFRKIIGNRRSKLDLTAAFTSMRSTMSALAATERMHANRFWRYKIAF